jgi:hypothetical protein
MIKGRAARDPMAILKAQGFKKVPLVKWLYRPGRKRNAP